MKAVDIARKAWEESGISQKKLAEKIGIKTQQGVFRIFNAKQGMRIDSFVKIMNALGYDVVVRNKVNDKETIVEVGACDTDTDE